MAGLAEVFFYLGSSSRSLRQPIIKSDPHKALPRLLPFKDSKLIFKITKGKIVINAEFYYFYTRLRIFSQEIGGLTNKNFCTSVFGEAKDTGTDSRQRDASHIILRSQDQRTPERIFKFIIFIPFAHSRANSMY